MPNILIVCTANICRSPIAEVLLRNKLAKRGFSKEWHVSSVGTWARDGDRVPSHSKSLMAHLGHDMSRHRSRTVSGALLDSADLIFTMEGNHKEALVAEFPASAEKIFLFSEMTGYPQDIRDPYGGSVIDYQEAIQEIAAYIEKGFEKVIELSQR